jgi:nucleotide-binding universal stress UspA family protein
LDVAVGQLVRTGEAAAIIEPMKMQNIIRAERDGTVKAVNAKAGESVAADEVLVEFARWRENLFAPAGFLAPAPQGRRRTTGVLMYKRIVLAYDSSREGRAALREGALLAKRCNAQVFLLSVAATSVGLNVSESTYPGPVAHHEATQRALLAEGVQRLMELGFSPSSELVSGDPTQAIGAYARRVGADLVVVGHRRQSLLERWWSGSAGGYLLDRIDCSLLISRRSISDAEFEAELAEITAGQG